MSIKLCVNNVNTIRSSKCHGAVRSNLNTILTLLQPEAFFFRIMAINVAQQNNG